MNLDLDKLEAAANRMKSARSAAREGAVSIRALNAARQEYDDASEPDILLALIAEVRALRAELNTPLLTGAYAPMYDGIFAAEGINHDVAMWAFYANAPTVTVYYGRRHVYTCMAEFCAEYSKEPT